MNLKKFISDYVADVKPDPADEDSNESPSSTSHSSKDTKPKPIRPVSPSPTTSTSTISSSGIPDAVFVDKLHEKLKAAPQQQVIEQFSGVVESLSEFIPEEGQRYRAALKQLQKSGFDTNSIVDAYAALVGVLDGEQTKFKEVVEQERDNEIVARERTIDGINAEVQAKEVEIKGLIDQRDSVASEIVDRKTKINTTENNFDGAVTVVRREVEDALRKIKLYLPSPAPVATGAK